MRDREGSREEGEDKGDWTYVVLLLLVDRDPSGTHVDEEEESSDDRHCRRERLQKETRISPHASRTAWLSSPS